MTSETLVVSEAFSPTVQGEGPSAGRRAGFIRLGGCDLHCSWCDAAYTWDASRFSLRTELARRPVDELARTALTGNPGLVVITGGEPLLHQDQPGWVPLLDLLGDAGADIEVETNGTRAPSHETVTRVSRFNVSPKLAHAGDPEHLRINPDALDALIASGRAVFKFVCRDTSDLYEASTMAARYLIPPRLVWIMPEGTTPDVINRRLGELADPVIALGFNLTTRLHILAWGDERGR